MTESLVSINPEIADKPRSLKEAYYNVRQMADEPSNKSKQVLHSGAEMIHRMTGLPVAVYKPSPDKIIVGKHKLPFGPYVYEKGYGLTGLAEPEQQLIQQYQANESELTGAPYSISVKNTSDSATTSLKGLSYPISSQNVADSIMVVFRAPNRELTELEQFFLEGIKDAATIALTREYSNTDPLTKLLNRRGLEVMAENAIRTSQRKQAPLTAAILDVDKFKLINDKYGHRAGDAALKAIALILNSFLRRTDFVGRSGGDEFTVFLPDTGQNQAIAALNRALDFIRITTISFTDEQIPPIKLPTLSVGIFQIPIPDDPKKLSDPSIVFSHAVNQADKAAYGAKLTGRNRICLMEQDGQVRNSSGKPIKIRKPVQK